MAPTLQEGDFVLVWKPVIGARIFNPYKSLILKQNDIYRLPGFRKIQHNDVVIFNFPYPNEWSRIEMHILKYYIKRCIGLPGDTLFIKKGKFRIKGYTGTLGNIYSQERIGKTHQDEFEPGTYLSYPYDSTLNWNIQNFGPLYIPQCNYMIPMNHVTYVLYRKPIEWETGGKLSIRDNTFYLNDSIITTYYFRKNYYFVAGDRGENSKDSRYWGLLPEEYIVGIASRIWKSKDQCGNIRWNRILKKIE